MSDQRGSALVLAITALAIIALVAAILFTLGKIKVSTPQQDSTTSSNLKIESPLTKHYQNPFSSESYVNPFEDLK